MVSPVFNLHVPLNIEYVTRNKRDSAFPTVYTVKILNSSSDGVFLSYSVLITNVLQTGESARDPIEFRLQPAPAYDRLQ